MRYNHAFTIAFALETPHPGDSVPADDIRDALRRRLHELNDDELVEAVGMPFETYNVVITNDQRAEWAAFALDEYGRRKEGRANYDVPEGMAADLICDLLHLIRGHGWEEPLEKLEMARTNFEAEDGGEQ